MSDVRARHSETEVEEPWAAAAPVCTAGQVQRSATIWRSFLRQPHLGVEGRRLP